MHYTEDELREKTLLPGDLLVCEGGDIGRAAIWEGQIAPCGFQNHLHRLRPKTANVHPPFFMYALRAGFTQLGIFEGAGNRTTIPNLSRSRLASLELPCPGAPEQMAVASLLRQAERRAATEKRLIATLSELKQAAMQQFFTRGLRGEEQKETEIGRMPRSWRLTTLGDVTRLERGRFTHRPRNEPRFYGGSTPFVQTGDVVESGGRIRRFSQTLNEAGVAISRVFPEGTVLITIAANIAFTGILTFPSACPDSLIGITPKDGLDAEYLNYYLQTQQPEMDRLAPKGTQKNINLQFLRPWPVAVPSVDEQRDIVAALRIIDDTLECHEHQRMLRAELFETLLGDLMTGRLRVADAAQTDQIAAGLV